MAKTEFESLDHLRLTWRYNTNSSWDWVWCLSIYKNWIIVYQNHLEDTGIDVFWLYCAPVPLDTKENEFGSSNQEASLSAGKNIAVALEPCGVWKYVPTTISDGADISKVCWCHLLQQMSC